jgi:hypothetical protein
VTFQLPPMSPGHGPMYWATRLTESSTDTLTYRLLGSPNLHRAEHQHQLGESIYPVGRRAPFNTGGESLSAAVKRPRPSRLNVPGQVCLACGGPSNI